MIIGLSLKSLVGEYDEAEAMRLLASFSCEENTDVEDFLIRKAIGNEKQDLCRTTVLFDDDQKRIAGYFTITLKSFYFQDGTSKSLKSRLAYSKYAESFESILIAQLGRADAYKEILPGKRVLQQALGTAKLIYDSVPLRIVTVEYQSAIDYLHLFYESAGFKKLQLNNETGNQLAFLRMGY